MTAVEAEMRQVVMNLVINAMEAIDLRARDGSRRRRRRERERQRARRGGDGGAAGGAVTVDVRRDDVVELAVSDDGAG